MSERVTEGRTEQHVDLDATVEEVWTAVTTAEGLGAWLGADVAIDVRVAGSGHVVDDDGTRRDVLVTDVEPGRRLAWHWWDDSGSLSSVELTLAPVPGATRLQVVEVLVPDAPGRIVACARTSRTSASRARAAGAGAVRPPHGFHWGGRLPGVARAVALVAA